MFTAWDFLLRLLRVLIISWDFILGGFDERYLGSLCCSSFGIEDELIWWLVWFGDWSLSVGYSGGWNWSCEIEL